MRILVADDDPSVRESLRRSLSFNGYDVTEAEDGAAALLAIAKDPPDALILDINMPVLDGLEACRRLRASGNDLPVLMLTARDDMRDRVLGLDAGADDYLPKPFALGRVAGSNTGALATRSRRRTAVPRLGLRFGDLIARSRRRAKSTGEIDDLTLTRTEFSLLELLITNPKRVLTRATSSTRSGATTFRRRRTRSRSTSDTCVERPKPTENLD